MRIQDALLLPRLHWCGTSINDRAETQVSTWAWTLSNKGSIATREGWWTGVGESLLRVRSSTGEEMGLIPWGGSVMVAGKARAVDYEEEHCVGEEGNWRNKDDRVSTLGEGDQCSDKVSTKLQLDRHRCCPTKQ